MDLNPINRLVLTEIVAKAAGAWQEPASLLRRPTAGGSLTRRIDADGYAIIGLDLIFGADGRLYLCEANGSNMAGSSFGAPDGDVARAAHQIAAGRDRILGAERGVVLTPYARGTGCLPEIITRASLISDIIGNSRACALADAGRELTSPMSVVVDGIENIADHLTTGDGKLFFRGVPVVSAANTNLLAELVRRGVVERQGHAYGIDTSIFHDGPFVPLAHDRGAQQALAEGTGITPLWWRECADINSCIAAVGELHASGRAAVVKMHAGSGGAGVEFFSPSLSHQALRDGLNALLRGAADKYGDQVHRTVYPLRVFEFVQSTGYPVGLDRHLWDMRVMVMISPQAAHMSFCGIRTCPEPFVQGRFDKGAVLSNTTGRRPDLSTTHAPLVEHGKPAAALLAAGVDEARLVQVADACAAWCQAAWRLYA